MAILPVPNMDAMAQIIPLTASDMQFIASYGGTTNLVYYGIAKVGVLLGQAGWRITKLTYDANNQIVRQRLSLNGSGKSNFDLIWQSDIATATILSVSVAPLALFTTVAPHGLINDDRIEIIGSDEASLNGDGFGGVMWRVVFVSPTEFTVINMADGLPLDSSVWGAPAAAGTIYKREYANYIVG